jgi:hypothetical protein
MGLLKWDRVERNDGNVMARDTLSEKGVELPEEIG